MPPGAAGTHEQSPAAVTREMHSLAAPRPNDCPGIDWQGRFSPRFSGDGRFLAPPHLVVASFLGLWPLRSKSRPPSSWWLSPLLSPVGMSVVGGRPAWITQRDLISRSLSQSHQQRPSFQIRSHSRMLGVGTWTQLLGATVQLKTDGTPFRETLGENANFLTNGL